MGDRLQKDRRALIWYRVAFTVCVVAGVLFVRLRHWELSAAFFVLTLLWQAIVNNQARIIANEEVIEALRGSEGEQSGEVRRG